jgi:hypothetical protein
MYEINKLLGLLSGVIRNVAVDTMYCLKQVTGHSFVSSVNMGTMDETGSSCPVILVLNNVNVRPSGASR